MEEEEHTDRKQRLALLYKKLDKIKKYLNEDDTDNINQVIGSNSPESCLTYLMDLEKKGNPYLDHNHLTRLVDFYTRVFSNMPLGKHCQNKSYAKMLVRFAELKGIQDVNEAIANFNVARSHSQNFAFVHIAHAQFEHSQGNTKKAIHILQRAIELDAKPKELLETALQNLQSAKTQLLCTEDKKNSAVFSHKHIHDSAKGGSELQKTCRKSEEIGDLKSSSVFGSEALNGSLDEQLPDWKYASQRKRVSERCPVVSLSITEIDDDCDGISSRSSDAFLPSSLSRQTSGSSTSSMFTLSSSQKKPLDGAFPTLKLPDISTESRFWEDQATMDSTTTLLCRQGQRDASPTEDTTQSFDQIINSDSPELCRTYLLDLEKRGNLATDYSLLTKLKDCYSRVFARMPMGKYSKSESYARMLVRYAELKGIEDPDEAQDHFIVAGSNCKGFAFIHIAHAQFEASQGNMNKATSILRKAQALNARPASLLELAIRNLKDGSKQLVIAEEKDSDFQNKDLPCHSTDNGSQEPQILVGIPISKTAEQLKSSSNEPLPTWKIPATLGHRVSSEAKHTTPPDPWPLNHLLDSIATPSLPLPSRLNPLMICQTPKNNGDIYANSYCTPDVKREHDMLRPSLRQAVSIQKHCTPLIKGSIPAFTNESITIKDKQFFILKMIGRGGSSKVFQVLDQNKQLFAVKYVNLEDADAQTVEGYKNEIEHLNHLQQYSDQIIKLYDYEITNSYICMLMECGNLDLNTWLRNRKTVNPLERKFYWKNMLEAVHTIHKHGIVHSDLKPANFVIVNASLKLIDFGIANRIQPDVTSIMKDSQVGTLNYMPPEAIKDTSSQPGKASSKVSPKGDVWSLGCILYCMAYGKTPFQSITNQINKLHAIIDPFHEIEFPDITEKDLLDVLQKCLVRNPRERISIAELLEHPYLQLQQQPLPEEELPFNSDLKRILTDLAALQSPNSIVRAANNLAKMCNSGKKLDVSECVKSSSQFF